MANFFEKTFKLSENKTTVKTEIIAGLTTFFAMCYIVVVNPGQMTGFSQGPEMAAIWNACFVGGIISAVIATLLMAFVAKLPFALAAGMGLNSLFFVSFILPALIPGGSGTPLVNYGAGLVVILLSGLIFLILSVTGLRSKIARSLPDCLKKAIPAGIGLFIAFLGMQGSKIIVGNEYTIGALGDLTQWMAYHPETGAWLGGAAPIITAMTGFLTIAILSKYRVKGSIAIGILVSTVLYYVTGCGELVWAPASLGTVFGDFFAHGFSALNPSSWVAAFDGVTIGSVLSVLMVMLSFCLVDMFDTIGTLYGAASEGGMLDENGDPNNMDKAMLADSVGTCVGAMTGSSTITTFVESSAGVAVGGRTGLTGLVVSACFLLCLFVSPLASLVPQVATGPALMWVGVLMMKNFSDVDMKDIRSSVPAFLALIMMPLTFSISNGIGIGCIAYVVITLCTGEFKKNDIIVTIIALLFALKFILVGG